eukprot:10222785-Alexandrium_andersonii.AAC.1
MRARSSCLVRSPVHPRLSRTPGPCTPDVPYARPHVPARTCSGRGPLTLGCPRQSAGGSGPPRGFASPS